MNPSDKRVIRTKTAIVNEFKKMICKLDSGDITVRELADRIGISRKTFYTHFDSLETLFLFVIDEIVEQYMDKMRKLAIPIDIVDQTRVFFEYYCNQEPYVERIMCNPTYVYYSDLLTQKAVSENAKRYFPTESMPPIERRLVSTYLIGSSVGLYRQWVRDKKEMPLERLIDISCALISSGYKSVVKSKNASGPNS